MKKIHNVFSHSNNSDKVEDSQRKRIWQKIHFGKILIPLDSDFWKYNYEDTNTDEYWNNPKLWTIGEVFEKDNKRYTIISNGNVLEINPDDLLYNYIDKGRKILLDGAKWYVFNELDINNDITNSFIKYRDREKLDLNKILSEVNENTFLFYSADIKQVKIRLKEIQKEAEKEKEQELKGTDELEKINEFLKNYKDLKIIEDKGVKIENNILIDKEKNMKLIFTRKIVDLFTEKELFEEKRSRRADNFIRLGYRVIFTDLEQKFHFYYNEEEEGVKYYKQSPRRFNFKIYVYNPETNEEKFLINFKFEVKKGKCYWKYFINNIRVPKQKVSRVIGRLTYNYYGGNLEGNAFDYNNYLTNIKKYSQTQLDLLEKGISSRIEFEGIDIPVRINITNPENEVWKIQLGNHSWKSYYNNVRILNRRYYQNDIMNLTNVLAEAINLKNKTEVIEDILIEYLKEKRKAIEVYEKKAKKLWEDTIKKYPDKILLKDNKIIVKGKLKTYRLKIVSNDVKVYTYPDENYICIHGTTREGQELLIHDKLVQFALALINDNNLREEIHTLT